MSMLVKLFGQSPMVGRKATECALNSAILEISHEICETG
jgi:hypothetical protein